MLPSYFIRVDAIPLTANGKVDRAKLPMPLRQTDDYAEPSTPVERQLVSVWERVMGQQQIGVNDDFFDLGGDSIMNIQIVMEARRAGIEITSAQLFEHATIAELAAVAVQQVGQTDAEPEDPVTDDEVTGDFSLSGLSDESLRLIQRRFGDSDPGRQAPR